jgi:hypothetical protein
MALMFPFEYQLIYIPVVPESMIEFLNSPVPFVAGVCKKFADPSIECVSKDTCIADIDANTVEFKDEENGKYVGQPESIDLALLPKHETDKLISCVAENWYLLV